jgi:hypothetical protein
MDSSTEISDIESFAELDLEQQPIQNRGEDNESQDNNVSLYLILIIKYFLTNF